ncbi:hypothetical protein LG651_11145 [Tamlana sp. 62-3]|uniref:Uncharacterized protein n=1 Tax=Neotamlana sargassicola TaxID=2883125 RepID=A0A9X1I7E3_9FLAO|nr:hypothetical protein [Tamlana sargassicola]MCB4808808.1 hypothetical protein [Tamlana sargassicola]
MSNNSLHNIKKSGFKVPQDYFTNLDDTLLTVTKLKNEVNKTGFSTPNNYFDTLETSVLNKVSKRKATKVISIFSKKNIVYASSIAAAVILLFSLTLFNKQNISWNTLDVDTVENYILNEDLTSYDMANLFADEDFNIDNFINHDFEEENIESYLIDHIDLDDFIEE